MWDKLDCKRSSFANINCVHCTKILSRKQSKKKLKTNGELQYTTSQRNIQILLTCTNFGFRTRDTCGFQVFRFALWCILRLTWESFVDKQYAQGLPNM